MRTAISILVLAAFASTAAAQTTLPEGIERPMTIADLPPGYPPKMGEITGMLGKKPVAWETFDFSVGAFDASAWAEADWNSKVVTANLSGYPPGQPRAAKGLHLWVKGSFGKTLHTGAADQPVSVTIFRGPDQDGARLTSDGQAAELVIDSIGPAMPDSYSRRVTGHITARLCPKGWLFQKCQPLSLRFDTDLQVSSDLAIAE